MFVRNTPLDKPVNTDTAYAWDTFIPGMNIPLVPPPDAGEYNRLVTRTESPTLVNSTAPAVAGELNVARIMSSNARDSRGPSTNTACGPAPGHAPRKHRYTAVTDTDPVYDVLNTRTSEKTGSPPTRQATTSPPATSPCPQKGGPAAGTRPRREPAWFVSSPGPGGYLVDANRPAHVLRHVLRAEELERRAARGQRGRERDAMGPGRLAAVAVAVVVRAGGDVVVAGDPELVHAREPMGALGRCQNERRLRARRHLDRRVGARVEVVVRQVDVDCLGRRPRHGGHRDVFVSGDEAGVGGGVVDHRAVGEQRRRR